MLPSMEMNNVENSCDTGNNSYVSRFIKFGLEVNWFTFTNNSYKKKNLKRHFVEGRKMDNFVKVA